MTDRNPTNDATTAYGILCERIPELEDGIRDALNGPYYAIQTAIGQDDGGIASLHASGRENDIATRLATAIVNAGWDGRGIPAWVEADHGRLLPEGETVAPGDLEDSAVAKAVDDFLGTLARQTGVDAATAFDGAERHDLAGHFREYLEMESSYAHAP